MFFSRIKCHWQYFFSKHFFIRWATKFMKTGVKNFWLVITRFPANLTKNKLIHSAGSDHCFHTCRPSVRHTSQYREKNNFQVRIVIGTVEIVDLSGRGDHWWRLSCFFLRISNAFHCLQCRMINNLFTLEKRISSLWSKTCSKAVNR